MCGVVASLFKLQDVHEENSSKCKQKLGKRAYIFVGSRLTGQRFCGILCYMKKFSRLELAQAFA